jgi:UrcA family protein
MLKTSLMAAAAICAAAAAPALAQEADVAAPQRSVSYADLNLSSPAGVATLDRRIDMAVTLVCASADLRDLRAWEAIDHCRAEARSKVELTRNALLASAKAQTAAKSVTVAAK